MGTGAKPSHMRGEAYCIWIHIVMCGEPNTLCYRV